MHYGILTDVNAMEGVNTFPRTIEKCQNDTSVTKIRCCIPDNIEESLNGSEHWSRKLENPIPRSGSFAFGTKAL